MLEKALKHLARAVFTGARSDGASARFGLEEDGSTEQAQVLRAEELVDLDLTDALRRPRTGLDDLDVSVGTDRDVRDSVRYCHARFELVVVAEAENELARAVDEEVPVARVAVAVALRLQHLDFEEPLAGDRDVELAAGVFDGALFEIRVEERSPGGVGSGDDGLVSGGVGVGEVG